MKSGDKTTVSVLRMLLSSLRYASIAEKRNLSDEEVAALVQKSIRSRKESIDAFRSGGRTDLAEREEAELKILERYLPPSSKAPSSRKPCSSSCSILESPRRRIWVER
jgi:uncharacterized protein YqeY